MTKQQRQWEISEAKRVLRRDRWVFLYFIAMGVAGLATGWFDL